MGNQSPSLRGKRTSLTHENLPMFCVNVPGLLLVFLCFARLQLEYKRLTYQVLISFSYLISKNINHSLGGEYFGGKEYSKESRLFGWFSS